MTGKIRQPLANRAGLIAGPLFVTTALIEGARRPGYRPVRHPISSLAFGPGGGVQVANFLVTGALYGYFAAGLVQNPGDSPSPAVPAFVGSAALGLVVSGLFRTDPVNGYPPGTPDESTPTAAGIVHNLAAVPLVVGTSGAAVLEAVRSFRRGEPMWSAYPALTGVLTPITFVAAAAGFAQQPAVVDRAGLLQRIFVSIGLGWMTALAVRRLVAAGSVDRDEVLGRHSTQGDSTEATWRRRSQVAQWGLSCWRPAP